MGWFWKTHFIVCAFKFEKYLFFLSFRLQFIYFELRDLYIIYFEIELHSLNGLLLWLNFNEKKRRTQKSFLFSIFWRCVEFPFIFLTTSLNFLFWVSEKEIVNSKFPFLRMCAEIYKKSLRSLLLIHHNFLFCSLPQFSLRFFLCKRFCF